MARQIPVPLVRRLLCVKGGGEEGGLGWGVKRGKGQGQVGDRWAPCNNHSRRGEGLTAILCKTVSLAANSLGIQA